MINYAVLRCISVACFLLKIVLNGYFTAINLTTERYVKENGNIKLNIIDRVNVMKHKVCFLHFKSLTIKESS